MVLRMQVPVVWVAILFMCVWFFLPFFKSSSDQDYGGYSVNDFNEDMGKLYYDLGKLSQRRGDFQNAIKSYTLALAHNPEHSICMNNIEICKEKLKENMSGAVDLLTKLDSID